MQQGIAAILALGNLDFGDSPDDQAALLPTSYYSPGGLTTCHLFLYSLLATDDQAALSDPNLVQIAIDFLGAADLEQALLKAYHLLTTSYTYYGCTSTHRKQALLKATLKVSKTESYTIELDATKARCNLP